jgi:hypothetical protein
LGLADLVLLELVRHRMALILFLGLLPQQVVVVVAQPRHQKLRRLLVALVAERNTTTVAHLDLALPGKVIEAERLLEIILVTGLAVAAVLAQ